MTSISGAASYLRPALATAPKTTLTRADALPEAVADASPARDEKYRVQVSEVKKFDSLGLKIVSIDDMPELRDRMATHWLNMQAAESRLATEVPDNAPQNIYATVKVDGKVVATLYNSGGSMMTAAAAGAVGDLQDPPGLNGGPHLAQARAERIAKVLGGTIEKAPTAITQSQWTPRPDISTSYSRTQLDNAYLAIKAEGARATAQRLAGFHADFNA